MPDKDSNNKIPIGFKLRHTLQHTLAWSKSTIKVYGNFVKEPLYFATLFELILTLYQIPFEHQAVNDLRESLRVQAER